jgi:hypothetical protein
LYASNNYTFSGYIYVGNPGGNVFGANFLMAALTTGTSIMPTTVSTAIAVSGSGWVPFSVTLTVPSNGSSYNLVIGCAGACLPTGSYLYCAFDDLSLTEAPCRGNAGSNQANHTGCCGVCPGSGVVIGTPSLSGLTYSWACNEPTCYMSSASASSPTVSPCYTATPTQYTLTISGPGCITSQSTVTVTTSQYVGANCCRLANPNAPVSDVINQPSHFTIFPNPASSEVTLSLSKSLDHLKIMDVSGKVIYETKDVGAGDLKIDVSRYAKGVYFIIGKTGNDTEKQKFIVE